MLTKVAELYWEQQEQITDEHTNALISETLSQLREEGGKDIVFNWWDRFTAPKTMEPADVVRLWIKARVRKEVAKKESESKTTGFKAWFKRKLGIHMADGVEVVDLGNVNFEQIKRFAEK